MAFYIIDAGCRRHLVVCNHEPTIEELNKHLGPVLVCSVSQADPVVIPDPDRRPKDPTLGPPAWYAEATRLSRVSTRLRHVLCCWYAVCHHRAIGGSWDSSYEDGRYIPEQKWVVEDIRSDVLSPRKVRGYGVACENELCALLGIQVPEPLRKEENKWIFNPLTGKPLA